MEESSGTSFFPPCRWNLVQFGLMCAYTMGLTSIWKFPYLVYKHTGLFLVAYYILLVLICIPVAFIQLKLGGVLGRSIVSIFSHYLPALKGVAIAILGISFLQCVYHAVYLSYAVYYMFVSLPQPYVWSYIGNATRVSSSFIYFAGNPAEHYYYNEFLQVSDGISSPGGVPWYLVISLLTAWLITYIFVCRGPSWFGRAVYGTSPVAIGLLFALLVYSHTAVPAAHESLGHFFSEQRTNRISRNGHGLKVKNGEDILMSELASPLTWIRALEQHIYSLGLWAGLLPTLGSHLGNKKPASNLTWLIVLLVHSMLPHLGTIAVAPFIHALAVHKHLPFEEVINSGPYLLFVVLPESFAMADINPLWVLVLYMCFFLFALHQQALLLIVIMENIVECFDKYIQIVFRRREIFTLAVCTLAFLLGLPQLTQGGSYLTKLVDLYLYRVLYVIILLSVIPFVLAYAKLEAFHLPIERLCMCAWFAAASLAVCALLVYNYIVFLVPYTDQLKDPDWARCLGWFVAVGPLLLCIAAGFIHALWASEETGFKRFLSIWKPSSRQLSSQYNDNVDPDDILQSQEGGGTLKFRKKASKLPTQPKSLHIPNGEPPLATEEDGAEPGQSQQHPHSQSPSHAGEDDEEEEEDDEMMTEPQTEETITTDSQPTAEMEVCIDPPANGHVAHL